MLFRTIFNGKGFVVSELVEQFVGVITTKKARTEIEECVEKCAALVDKWGRANTEWELVHEDDMVD